MTPNSFNEKDKEKLIRLLNVVAEKARFQDMKVTDVIEFYSLLAWSQKELISKIEANVLEVVRASTTTEETSETPSSTPPPTRRTRSSKK
jgi:hypothetical protein